MFKDISKICLVMLLMVATVLLAGCFQIERTVRLNSDGGGTVEEVVLIGKALTGMFDSMKPGEEATPDKGATKSKENDFTEQARGKAADMGEGVTLVSVTPVTQAEFEGFRAVYAFKDINTLKLRSDPTPTDQQGGSGTSNTYRFTKGDKSVLVIRNGSAAKSKASPAEEGLSAAEPVATQNQQAGQQAMEMFKQIFNGMRISERIVITDGTVIESNALFRSGSEITVLDIDFGKLLATNPEQLLKLQSVPKDNKQKLLQAMGTIPGFKVDVNDELTVAFRKRSK